MKIKHFLLPFVEHLNNRKDEFSALCMVYFSSVNLNYLHCLSMNISEITEHENENQFTYVCRFIVPFK